MVIALVPSHEGLVTWLIKRHFSQITALGQTLTVKDTRVKKTFSEYLKKSYQDDLSPFSAKKRTMCNVFNKPYVIFRAAH